MAAEPSSMTLEHHFPKRKARLSIAVPGGCRLGRLGSFSKTPSSSRPSLSPTSAGPTPVAESANLASALTALKVSLKRDLDSFAPPTPAVSPAHGRSGTKRMRCDFESSDGEEPESSPAKPSVALLAVSSRLKAELEKRRRHDQERATRPRKRQQLSYLAIIGAFHRAALERKASVTLAPRDLELDLDRVVDLEASAD